MNTITDALAAVKLGAAHQHANLAIFPLFASRDAAPDYTTLDEALAVGTARVTEVSEAGHVPELLFENLGDRSVLLVDGEELVGARQNRILNLSILVGAKTKVAIPVSCVERGRWSYQSAEFRASEVKLHSRARATKTRDVSRTLDESGSRRGDQDRVWEEIQRKQFAMKVGSPTEALRDVYTQRKADLDGYRAAFAARPGQVGAVFAINGRIRGVELFDAATTFAKFMQKTLGSYALDAAEEAPAADSPKVESAAAKAFLERLKSAPAKSFAALAQGEDVRLELPDVAGGALVAGDHLIHLAAFAIEPRAEQARGFRKASGG